MEKYLKYAIMSLIVFSLAAKFVLIFANHGMWWDEAVYLGLGRSINKGFYALEPGTSLESFRPPLFPFLISPISENIIAVRTLAAAFSVISIVITYFLAKSLFGKDCALWSSLFLSSSQLFVFFSTKALTEPLFISLAALSLMFFLKGGKPKYALYAFLAGAFAGLALITRYLGTILIISYGVYFIFLLFKKAEVKKTLVKFLLFSGGFLLALLPWLALSYFNYGSALGAYFTNMEVYAGSFSSSIYEYFTGFFDFSGLQIVFFLIGLYAMAGLKARKEKVLLMALFVVPVIFFLLAPHKEPRYMLSYAPVYAIFSGFALSNAKFKAFDKPLKYAALLVCLACLITGLNLIWNDRLTGRGLIEAAGYLKAQTGGNDVVMTESYPYVYYLAERKAARFPHTPEEMDRILKERGIKYAMLDSFEPGNPGYAAQYLENSTKFARLASFGQQGSPEAVIIYRVSG